MSDNLLTIAAFTPNSLEAPNAWIGHLPFAAWVMQEVSPKIFVELGTHSGNSYFSFCQSVLENSLDTKCYAVDSWQGDEHAGSYNEDIFNKVNNHNQDRYVQFSSLLRMTFDDAVSYFADESIGLLHIDGLHTYEAVAHDFETWLPKLEYGAVVIFHDTNVRERNFGVWKFWEELQLKYTNNFEFVHSHGLGVLQIINSSSTKVVKKVDWPKSNIKQQHFINYFAVLGARQLERYELNELKKHTLSQISHLTTVIQTKDQQLAEEEKAGQLREVQIAGLNLNVAEAESQLASLNIAVQERDQQIAVVNELLTEQEVQISHLTTVIQTKDQQLAEEEKAGQLRDQQIAVVNELLTEKEQLREVYLYDQQQLSIAISLAKEIAQC